MQSGDAELTGESNQLEVDPAKVLELKKLALEIAEMERPWWKRPTYILAALPTFLAIIALSVGFINGFFSAELTKLDNQKHDVEAQIKEFESKRDDLHRQYDIATQDLNKTKSQLNDLMRQASNIESTKKLVEAERERYLQCQAELQRLKTR
jgi:septal ring factor EnvC (AmiA/AmiB activator)